MKTFKQLAEKNRARLHDLETVMGYEFADSTILQQSLVHSSYGYEKIKEGKNNETLEFLGDAVLDLAVSTLLYRLYPESSEGDMTRMRSELVRESTLAGRARVITLGDFIMLGRGEEVTGGRQKPSILASSFEALLGAIYLDGGYSEVLRFIENHFSGLLPEKMGKTMASDAKSLLQEKLQGHINRAPSYHLDEERGPDHAKEFTVSVRILENILGVGSGTSKKAAEQQAALHALNAIDTWWNRVTENKSS